MSPFYTCSGHLLLDVIAGKNPCKIEDACHLIHGLTGVYIYPKDYVFVRPLFVQLLADYADEEQMPVKHWQALGRGNLCCDGHEFKRLFCVAEYMSEALYTKWKAYIALKEITFTQRLPISDFEEELLQKSISGKVIFKRFKEPAQKFVSSCKITRYKAAYKQAKLLKSIYGEAVALYLDENPPLFVDSEVSKSLEMMPENDSVLPYIQKLDGLSYLC